MVVQHNLRAMNSNRMLGLTASSQSKSTEKLSSGYKINRAADDAAGLAISEKMRKQIRGLTQASLNAQDGISAVQTAEGALTEVHDMLQRMNELAVKSANGTNSEDDRSYIQAEIKQLITEIDRVSTTTKFNETYLLKGDEKAGSKTVYSYKDDLATPSSAAFGAGVTKLYEADGTTEINDEDALKAYLDNDPTAKVIKTPAVKDAGTAATAGTDYAFTTASWTITGTFYANADTATDDTGAVAVTNANAATYFNEDGTLKDGFQLWDNNDGSGATATVDGTTNKVEFADASATITNKVYAEDGTEYTAATLAAALKADNTTKVYTAAPKVTTPEVIATDADYTYTPETKGKAQLYDEDGKAVNASDIADMLKDGKKLYADANKGTEVTEAELDTYTVEKTVNDDLELSLHVGADSSDDNKISLKIASMSAISIGVDGLDVSSKDTATAAIDTISEALKLVSKQRSDLGAIQNRLEHTINNLDNVVENTTAAESQIRDTDMATEMVKYSNNNILAQAGQAMLAQSNQANQGVLSLLQ